jgi:hypothetical protein
MSTKTLRKRIALVAVSALGAGLLSVVPVTSASATVNANSTSGAATATTSIGLLASGGAGTTQTAVLLATGAISTTGNAGASGTTMTATVTGGRFTAATGSGTPTISGTSSASVNANHLNSDLNTLAVPNAGATSMVITYTAITSTTATVTERITVTIVATSAFNVFAAAESTAYWGDGNGNYTTATDTSAANFTKANTQVLVGAVSLADAYGNALTSANTGILTATASSGAVVDLGSTSTAGSGTIDFASVTGSAITFNVQQATANAPWNGTVTFAFNGVVFATKSGVITGEVARVTAAAPKIGKSGTSNTGAAVISYADSAGNTVFPTSGTSAVSSTLGATVTGLSVGTYPSSGVPGLITMSCGSGVLGAVKGLQVEHLNASGTVVKSNTWDSGCADVPYSVVASWDKASYAPGTIATLTLAFKDRFGNIANAYDAIGTNGAGVDLTVTGGPSATAITPIADGDKPSGVTGAVTYQYVVTAAEGDYIAVIVPSEVQENTAARGVTTANISLPYSVKATTSAVSNADVLKAIVSLIASINKQIAALQKALLRR